MKPSMSPPSRDEVLNEVTVAPSSSYSTSSMKISSVEFIPVKVPFAAEIRPAWIPDTVLPARDGTVIKLTADDGTTTGYGWQNSAAAEIRAFGESASFQKQVVGLRLSDFERMTRLLSSFLIRMYGVEVAMWDAFGKSVGQPIYKLLGGAQDKVLAYASTAEMKSPKQQAEDAQRYWKAGFRAIKIRAHHDRMEDDLAVVAAIREAVPPEMKIMVDANQASPVSGPIWSYERALKTARELEKLDVAWLEEPLHHEALEDLARLCSAVDIPIAGAEDEAGLFRFRDLLARGCFDLVQPDASTSGGILQLRKIAIVAESMNRMMVPHSFDAGICIASALQVIGASYNSPYVEYAIDLPALDVGHEPLLKTPIELEGDGYVRIPARPGLGIEIDEDALERYRV